MTSPVLTFLVGIPALLLLCAFLYGVGWAFGGSERSAWHDRLALGVVLVFAPVSLVTLIWAIGLGAVQAWTYFRP